ncbi:BNR-4 repeat-containing protein [Coraliomargarita algicola]|uniref:BNR-4 repeat-containing protein n=1 Tax=Coraliomargarita algicola TaxID=3092156 RepID=A0ABZ0RMA4_9BACT|nr:BNR-4 repeat-containing protein [Coraliomargarita sp. J2-16]WPJ97349.1 BNR-4 repeat-containing protein [Coraliomargarita sp. J2-16]
MEPVTVVQPEVLRMQRLFQTPTSVGNGPGTFIYSPISSYRGHVYYTWLDDTRRPQIVQIRPDGSRIVTAVDAPDYQAYPDGHHRLSLGVDADGYIHIAGDMHGGVNDRKLSTERFRGANVLYWRSTRAGDVSRFDFLGKDPARTIPMPNATYAFFLRDRNDELYFAGRIVANPDRKKVPEAHRGVGLYRYDTEELTWKALGGTRNPVNGVELSKTLFNSVNEWGNLASPDTPIWYRWNMVGMAFDQHNRLHFAVNANTPMGEGTHVFYGASDDGGESWQRADGSSVALPMIDSLVPHANRPDMIFAPAGNDLGTRGPTYPFFDSRGAPAVSVDVKKQDAPSENKYIYWDRAQQAWSGLVDVPIPRARHWTKNFYLGRDGMINFVCYNRLYRAPGYEQVGRDFQVPGQFAFIDPIALLEHNVMLAVLGIGSERTAVYRIDFVPVPEDGWRSDYEDLAGSPLDEVVAMVEAGRRLNSGERGEFRPNDAITASEWVDMLLSARAWAVDGAIDSAANWQQALGEELLMVEREDAPLTRSDAITTLVRSAPGEAWPQDVAVELSQDSSETLSQQAWRMMASADTLGLLPAGWMSTPESWKQYLSRGEAIAVLRRLYFPEFRQLK